MKELKEISKAFIEATMSGKKTALATVVDVQGSAYRRPGARMLVTEDGILTGAISGGCLEGDALRKAQYCMVLNTPTLVTYDTTDEEDGLGVGLGCNGIITILFEPIDHNDIFNPVELLRDFLLKRDRAVLLTIYGMDKTDIFPGSCILVTGAGVKGSINDRDFKEILVNDAKEVLRLNNSCIKQYDSRRSNVLFQVLEPATMVYVFGAGNDSIPICRMSDVLGWETIVVDGRPNYATRERFPLCKKIFVLKPEAILPHIEPDSSSVALLMTHNYKYDLAILEQLFPMRLPYIGILGPKKKYEKMIDEIRSTGLNINEDDLVTIYSPAGLDIGAETSEEIALSIISEIKAVLSNRDARFLKEKTIPIHSG